MNMIADLIDPNDKNGRTYREVNNATNHGIKIGQLVELECGSRLFVLMHKRDCDGTPLYVIGLKESNIIEGGYPEESLNPA